MLKVRRFRNVLAVTLALCLSTSGLCYASFADYGTPLSEAEMTATEGEWGPLLAAIVGGIFTSAFKYATSTANPTMDGLLSAIGQGIVAGVLGGTFGIAGKIATGASLAIKPAELAWAAWGGANAGALSGPVGQIYKTWVGN